jgi:tetratricopeptide (TPR) repeat protein
MRRLARRMPARGGGCEAEVLLAAAQELFEFGRVGAAFHVFLAARHATRLLPNGRGRGIDVAAGIEITRLWLRHGGFSAARALLEDLEPLLQARKLAVPLFVQRMWDPEAGWTGGRRIAGRPRWHVRMIAWAARWHGELLLRTGADETLTLEVARAAVAAAEPAWTLGANSPWDDVKPFDAHLLLCRAALRAESWGEAARAARQALDLHRRHAETGREEPDVVVETMMLGYLAQAQGRMPAPRGPAIDAALTAIAAVRAALRTHAATGDGAFGLLRELRDLAKLLAQLYADEDPALLQRDYPHLDHDILAAADLLVAEGRRLDIGPPGLAAMIETASFVRACVGDITGADALWQQAAQIVDELDPLMERGALATAVALANDIGNWLLAHRHHEAARLRLEAAARWSERLRVGLGARGQDDPAHLLSVANVLMDEDRMAESAQAARSALRILDRMDAPAGDRAAAAFMAARAERGLGRLVEAERLARKGVTLTRGSDGERVPLLSQLLQHAEILEQLRRDDDACTVFEQAAEVSGAFAPSSGAPDHSQAHTLVRLSEVAERAGKGELAQRAAQGAAEYARVVVIFDSDGARLQASARARLGDILRRDERGEEAVHAYRDAIDLFPPDVRAGDAGRLRVAQRLVATLEALGRQNEASAWRERERLPV